MAKRSVTPVHVWPGQCSMLVPTYVELARLSVTCWYIPVQVCPGVPVNLVLHLQSVRELASPLVSLLIGQLEHSDDPDLNVFFGQAENTRVVKINFVVVDNSNDKFY